VRILLSQVPGGMLTNMRNQLKEQNASDKYDQVLAEIPIVQKDCGSVPLVTPTSQIVGTQAVFNVLFGRYKNITNECADLATGRYGKTPGPVNPELRAAALKKMGYSEALECRPADKIPLEWDKLVEEAKKVGAQTEEDYLDYAMFPKVAPGFFAKRAQGPISSDSFAVKPAAAAAPAGKGSTESYTVQVNGTNYNVVVAPAGTVLSATPVAAPAAASAAPAAAPVSAAPSAGATVIDAPVAGTLLRYAVSEGASVQSGDNVIIMESMKMELEIKATSAGTVHFLKEAGAAVAQGDHMAEVK
jgi:oxaloacetate decarboxylase alpha subunit